MESVHEPQKRRNGLVGLYGYSRTPQHLRDYIHIEAQLTPELYLVGDCHHSPENGIVSRRIMLICELARCTFYTTHVELKARCEYDLEQQHARIMRRMTIDGVYDPDADYNGMPMEKRPPVYFELSKLKADMRGSLN